MTGAAGHLVHGMGLALEEPTWPAITWSEAEAIVMRFPDAGQLIDVRWHSPRPFSAAALIHTDRGEFLLKRHHGRVRDPAGLAEEHMFISHLRDGGISVPEVMLSEDNSGSVSTGEWCYELHRKAPGFDLYRDRASWTPFLSHSHAHAAGVALAQLHRVARSFDGPARTIKPLLASMTILPASDPVAAAQAYVSARPALSAFLASKPWQVELTRLFERLGSGLSTGLAHQPPLWTHNDWHPSNLLWDAEGRVRTVFDFGLADRTCALHDLAIAIERAAIEWLQMDQPSADFSIANSEAACALLTGYATILPLKPADVDTIVRLLPLVHVEFALSEVDYFAGILADSEQAAVAWEDYLIGHAEWFLSPAGQHFLGQITVVSL